MPGVLAAAQATSEDTTDASAKVIQVFASVGRGMVDATFLRGMYNILDTIANADKGHVVERFAGATAQRRGSARDRPPACRSFISELLLS
jgi:hypothetical protein